MEDNSHEFREDRGPRISKAKIESLQTNPAAPKISIFLKADKDSSVQFVQTARRDTAMVFCDRIRAELLDNNSKSFTVIGCDLEALKTLLGWIEQSVVAGRCEKFIDLDSSTPNLLSKYAWIVHAASYLGVPDRDLGDHIIKRMLSVHTKKTLMSWKEVDIFLYSPKLEICNQEIRDVAAASIFWGWWNAKLTDEETPEDMDYLCGLRDRDAKLDKDLKDLCASNEEEVQKKWAEKKAKKEQEHLEYMQQQQGYQAVQIAGSNQGWEAVSTADSGWTSVPFNGNPQVSSGGWEQPGSTLESSAGNCWNGSKTAADATWTRVPDSGFDAAANDQASSTTFPATEPFGIADPNVDHEHGNWADQVNHENHLSTQCW